MVILGIDPALCVTGYGAIESKGGKKTLLEAGIITTKARDLLVCRLDKIYRQTAGLICDIQPDVVVLEKIYSHYRHPTTSYQLGQARGVICLACAQKNVDLAEYAATRVKKAVVGRGLASKLQVQKMVADLLEIKTLPKYTDVTDALALAIAHAYIAGAQL